MIKIDFTMIDILYENALRREMSTNIYEHLPVLVKYAKECQHITEFGVRWGRSTCAFLYTRPKELHSYDLERSQEVDIIERSAKNENINFHFHLEDTTIAIIEETELLFIDSKHTYSQASKELSLNKDKISKYIIMHDVVTFGIRGKTSGNEKGLLFAITEFMYDNQDWKIKEFLVNNNGLLILEKK